MKNRTEPNNFFSKQDISLPEAIEQSRPLPPWKRFKKMKVIAGTPGKPAPRRWLYAFSVPLLLIEWALSAIVQIADVLRKSFETLILALESYINEPTRIPPSS